LAASASCLLAAVVLALAWAQGAGSRESAPGQESYRVFQLDRDLGLQSPAPGDQPPVVASGGLTAPVEALWRRIEAVERGVTGLLAVDGGRAALERVFTLDCDGPDPEGLHRERLLSEAARRDLDPGFSLRGAYT
jgi:hypothetical protein